MPRRISREEVEALALAERPAGRCLICAILSGEAGAAYVLHEAPRAVAVLSRYPRCWGQSMVLLRRHVTSYTDLEEADWLEASRLAWQVARQIERHLSPLRCYVSSLGSHRADLPMSSPHLHVHVDPVYDPEDRPRTILTLQHGALAAEPGEWDALHARLRW